MATIYPVAGSRIFIGGAVEGNREVTAADFADAAWVEIDGWANAGDVGDTQEVGTQSLINTRRVAKFKTILNGGTMENQFVPIPTDPGQIAFKAAAEDGCGHYMFKIEWGADCAEDEEALEGMTSMFTALALPGTMSGGDASAARLRSWTIDITSNLVDV